MVDILGQEKPSLSDLAHHGVKGMKWGVRKDDPSGGTTPTGKATESFRARRAASTAATAYMVNANKGNPMYRQMTPERYAALSNQGSEFARGMELNRITKVDSMEIRAGSLYVSKLQEDANFYKAIIPATGASKLSFLPGNFVSGGQKTYQSYEATLVTTKKLKLPSDKERVDAFMAIMSQPAINVPGQNAPITGRQYLEAHGYAKQFKGKTDQEAVFSAYYQLLRTQGDQSSPVNQAYFDHLRKKGYNAILDENDAGRYTKDPLIILDGNKTVKTTAIRQLTADEINGAQRALRTNPPPGYLAAQAWKQNQGGGTGAGTP